MGADEWSIMRFEVALGEIVQNLLLGHILNPKLDVQPMLK